MLLIIPWKTKEVEKWRSREMGNLAIAPEICIYFGNHHQFPKIEKQGGKRKLIKRLHGTTITRF
jgi:hypothetical protein